jgi:hypothetical protein
MNEVLGKAFSTKRDKKSAFVKAKVLGEYDHLYAKSVEIQTLKNEIEEAEVTGEIIQRKRDGIRCCCCARKVNVIE